jgi:formylglycine-generating enzyme required for sulfatase activity
MSLRPADPASFEERSLGPEEARAYLEAPVTEADRDDVRALVRWFRQRYPTPAERLAYVRRAYARWRRTLGIGANS